MAQKFFFRVQYLGTPFSGWQKQPQVFSVQQSLEETIKLVFDQKVVVMAAGRTDAGVHALGQMISFEIDTTNDAHAVRERINPRLPSSIYLTKGWAVDRKWHVIKSATKKHYRYLVYRHGFRSPLYEDRAWVLRRPLDTDAMAEAMGHFKGRHDFSSFKASDGTSLTSERTLEICRFRAKRDWLTFDFVGDGFLKHMVRTMVGTLVEVGLHQKEVADIAHILKAKDRTLAGYNAPPQGLYLMHVAYPRAVFGV